MGTSTLHIKNQPSRNGRRAPGRARALRLRLPAAAPAAGPQPGRSRLGLGTDEERKFQ